MTGLYFEEYTDDWSFRSPERTVTLEMLNTFVDLCGFTSPTFTNPEYAAKQYSGRMVPGAFGLALAEGFVINSGITWRRGIFAMELNTKFLRPLLVGDTVHLEVKLKSKRITSKPDRGVVVTTHELINQNGEAVLRYESAKMVRTRAFVEETTSAV